MTGMLRKIIHDFAFLLIISFVAGEIAEEFSVKFQIVNEIEC